jgi:Tol biopolymer transport system component
LVVDSVEPIETNVTTPFTRDTVRNAVRFDFEGHPRASNTFDWAMAALAALIVGGAYLDGWAHNHDKVDQSFFTPWHAILYGSIALNAAFMGFHLLMNHARGYPWRRALPAPYVLSFVGVVLFGAAGVTDMVWHILFGIEEDTEALVSPTHLALAASGVLIVVGPLRSALRGPVDETWRDLGPAVVSTGCIIALLAFMTQFAQPLSEHFTREETVFNALPDVYVMDKDGSNQRRITIDPEHWNGFAAWSPDGQRMVLTIGDPRNDGDSDLYVMNVDGSNVVQLTQTPGNDYSASWSPDGSKVAFISNTSADRQEIFNADVFVINADGSGLVRLTNSRGRAWGTSWSPDGKRIAFGSERDGGWRVYTMNADGSDQRRLTSGPGHDNAPSWSPDGKWIAFQHFDAGKPSIQVIGIDGTGTRALPESVGGSHPVWSPAGDQIAFVRFREDDSQIMVANADGMGVKDLTRGSGTFADLPSWSPDGTRILYMAQPGSVGRDFELTRRLGVASVLLQTALLMAPLLLIALRWRLPFGALTLIVFITGLLPVIVFDEYSFLPGILLSGLLADVLNQRLQPSTTPAWRLYAFAFLVPSAFYALYFLTLLVQGNVDWSVHLSAGAVVLAGVVGLLVSFMLVSPFRSADLPVEP